MYGLKGKHIEAINSVFVKHPEIHQATLYGSRAKGNYRNGSDIDLTLKGEQITLSQLFEIETELDDLLLPYKIDLSIYHKIENPEFIEHIKRVGIVFYEKEQFEEWKEYKLEDLGFLQRGRSRHRPRYAFHLYGGKYPFIQTGQIRESRKLITTYEQTYSEEGLKQSKLWPKGTLCITIAANIAELGILNFDACFPDSVLGFIPDKEKVDLNFIYYTLVFFQKQLKHIGEGSVQDNINLGTFQDVQFPIPKLSEQKAIANILTSFDDKIDLLHRQNETLEAMAETLFRQWFVEEADEDWEEKSLSGIATFLNGLACQKFPPKNEIDKLPVLKIKQLRNGFSNDSDWCTTDVKPEYIVKNGDVIFSWSASLMIKIWDGETAILNQHLFKVTSDEFPKWFYYLWSKFHLKEFISISESHATTMGHIKRSDLDNVMVLVPDDNKMIEFTQIQKPIIDKIIYNSKQLSTLTEVRDTLLPNLMNGDIKVMADD